MRSGFVLFHQGLNELLFTTGVNLTVPLQVGTFHTMLHTSGYPVSKLAFLADASALYGIGLFNIVAQGSAAAVVAAFSPTDFQEVGNFCCTQAGISADDGG